MKIKKDYFITGFLLLILCDVLFGSFSLNMIDKYTNPIQGAYGYKLDSTLSEEELTKDGFKRVEKELFAYDDTVGKSYVKTLQSNDPLVDRINIKLTKNNKVKEIILFGSDYKSAQENKNIFEKILVTKYKENASNIIAGMDANAWARYRDRSVTTHKANINDKPFAVLIYRKEGILND